MDQAKELLRKTFGFEEFRPGQAEVIGNLLAGRSTAAVFPTGSGKSLCYQLPALLLPGLTLVVSPLIALMKEQSERLRALGVAAASLDSTLSSDESRAVMTDIRSGKLRLLFLAPERFNNERTREALLNLPIALFAVDEAHCISEWGHNFRPDYLKLARFAQRCRAGRILALTATATPAVLDDVCRGFEIAPESAVRTGFYRPNLRLRTHVARDDRAAQLTERLRDRAPGPAIVYVTTQKTAERIAAALVAADLPAKAYHAGMDSDDRAAVQDWFHGSNEAIVVATIAFGMGIDKPNIRGVFHFNLPKSLENYAQEIGRAGRDGEPADCEVFVAWDDLNRLENFAYGDTPSPAAVRGLIQSLFAGDDDELLLNLTDVASVHDLRPSVLSTLLTYLELDGYLEAGTPIYSRYRFQPKATSAAILAQCEGEQRDFLAMIFRQAVKARTWFDLDLTQAIRATQSTRRRVVEALDHLGEQGLLELKADGLRHRYRQLKTPRDPLALADGLYERMLAREAREVGRLAQVMGLVKLDACQTAFLAAYFGETLRERCGHCTWCASGGRPLSLPRRPAVAIDPLLWQQALALQSSYADPLADPRALARFLCGLPSPRLTAWRLAGHRLYGTLDAIPFKQVLDQATVKGAPF